MTQDSTYSPIKISISILTYNRCQNLESLLSKLQKLMFKSIEILVVDNHSTDGTQEMICSKFPSVHYMRMVENIGTGARNFGLRAARGEIVVCLDDDIFGLSDKALGRLVNLFNKRPKLGAINFKIIDHDTHQISNWPHHCDPAIWSDKDFLTYQITEGAVAFRKSVLLKSGFYPDSFFLSHEGTDLAFRIIEAGFEVAYCPIVTVVHCHSEMGRTAWLNYYFDTRNQFWLAARNLPVVYSIRYLIIGIIKMFFYSIRDGYLLFWFKGVIDGISGLKNAVKSRRVLSESTMAVIKRIDQNKPSLKYYIRNRILRKGVRL